MSFDMDRRQEAVAINEQQSRRGRIPHSVVSTAGSLEAGMVMGHKTNRKRGRASKLADHGGRFVARAVVCNDHLERA